MSLPPRDLVRRIADINHWHMSRFRVIEDEQKVTFLLQPCGSGGRLINEGRYYLTGDRPFALMPRASRSTFSMPDFPVYCNHCSEMSRTILTGKDGNSCSGAATMTISAKMRLSVRTM